MNDILKNMDEEKKNKIINSAISEFSKYPYEKASTNNIVKNAEISKGLLFHYFGNKRDLYESVVGFVVNKLYNEIESSINWEETDIFLRIKQIVLVKLKISNDYPNMFDFILKVFINEQSNTLNDAISLYEKYGIDMQAIMGKIYSHNIDFTKFREQNDLSKNINIIRWTLEKYAEEQLTSHNMLSNNDFQRISSDIDEYIDVLKKTLY